MFASLSIMYIIISVYMCIRVCVYMCVCVCVCVCIESRDELGVQNLTALPRTQWAKIRATMSLNPVNRRSLHTIDSSFSFLVLEDASPREDVSYQAQAL